MSCAGIAAALIKSSSELSTQQILVPVSPLTQISSRRSSHRPASLRDTVAQKEAKEQAEEENIVKMAKIF